MAPFGVDKRGFGKTESSIALLSILAVTMVFVVVSVNVDTNTAENVDGSFTINYSDLSGTNSTASISGYFGIPATEYNPQFWTGTGNVGTIADWIAPDSDTSITVKSETIGAVKLTFDGTKNAYYTVNFPDTYNIKSIGVVSNASLMDESNLNIGISWTNDGETNKNSFTYKQGTGSNRSVINVEFYDITITPKKVFGGWYSDPDHPENYIYPGDVVDPGVGTLYARWITPDVFVLKEDWINWSLNKNASGGLITSISMEVVSPYANLGFTFKSGGDKDGKLGILEYNDESHTDANGNIYYTVKEKTRGYPIKYSMVIRGDGRTSSDMFGTIYHFTTERTKERIVYLNIGNEYVYPSALTTGTYRTVVSDNKYTLNLNFNDDKNQSAMLGGDVIIDNVILDCTTPSTHGDSFNGAIFANGHKLIMGTNITNLNLKLGDAGKVAGALQVFGGTGANITLPGYQSDITSPAYEAKKIIFGDGTDKGLTVNLGTYVIIHSGVYSNIMGGSYGKSDIGTSENNLSTYMVLKGGIAIDTVSGGMSMNDSTTGDHCNIYGGTTGTEVTGGTFIYVTGMFMPGDDWEDKESGCFTGDRALFSIFQSSILEGGNSRGKTINDQAVIHGSTHVFLSGTSSVWDVQAGGRSGFTHTDSTYLEITGKAVVRHVACGTITDGASTDNNCVDKVKIYVGGNATVANLYGAGYDTTFYPYGKSMISGTITVNVTGGKIGNVFGGGYRGSIGTESTPVTINVTISGGEVIGSVYGGGSGGLDKVKHNADGSFHTKNTGKYDQSMGRSYVYGNIDVKISGNAKVIGSVYGGGMSVPKLSQYSAEGKSITSFGNEEVNNRSIYVASVIGDTKVEVLDSATVVGSVYGGGKGISLTYSNSKWSVVGDYTTMTTVKVSKLDSEDPFFQLPWYATKDGSKYSYSFSYDTAVKFIKTDNSTITGAYLDYARVDGNTTVYIEGGTIENDVYGGGAQGRVLGSTTVEMNGGTVKGNIFGGGLGAEDVVSVTGSRAVYITGTRERRSVIGGSVYGSSSKGDDGTKNTYDSDSIIVIDQAIISGSVFGGGFLGETWGDTTVYIGYMFTKTGGTYSIEFYDGSNDRPIQISSVYAGGNVSTSADGDISGSLLEPFTQSLVKGHGSIYIYGNGNNGDISISGSLMGSGNACTTGMSTYIEVKNLQNKTKMSGIHRASDVLIYQSTLDISGRSTVTDNTRASLYSIGNLTLQFDTSIFIEHPADLIGNLFSLNKDGNATTAASPSNSIIFTGGATLYVRSAPESFGTVTGYGIIGVQGQSSYGAYVICNDGSPGGFVVTKDGIFRSAEYKDFGSSARCWYIGGTEKKVVSMELKANNPTDLVTTATSVDIMKMSDGTTIQYIGGTFTLLGSYSGTDPSDEYELVEPGKNGGNLPAENEFGLIFGHEGNNANLISDTEHSFEGIAGFTTSTRCTYFGSGGEPVSFNGGTGAAGAYKLNLMFTGAPKSQAAYLGYVTLNFQEVQEIVNNGQIYYMPLNSMEVRVDLYVMPADGDSAFGVNYDVRIKTKETGTGTNIFKGESDVLFPKTSSMTELKIVDIGTSIEEIQTQTGTEYKLSGTIPAGVKVQVISVMNQDNTTGWMISNSVNLDSSTNVGDGISVGILSGSSVATIRYNIEYTGDVPNDIYIKFSIPIGNVLTYSVIKLSISKLTPFAVTFKGVKGYETAEDPTRLFYYGSKLDNIQDLESGSGFIGWYLDSSYTSQYNRETPLTESITLYARYNYTVTLDNLDGSSTKLYIAQESGGVLINSTLLEVEERAGYSFGGWYKEKELIHGWDASYDRVSSDITLYAKWTGIEVKVVFKYTTPTGLKTFDSKPADYPEGYPQDPAYIMKMVQEVVGGQVKLAPLYPTVRIGSTFESIDPVKEKNILKYAQESIITELGGNTKFVRWQAFEDNDPSSTNSIPVYHDTVLTSSMVDYSGDMPEITLYAITSDVAIKIVMDKNTTDASAVVSAPNEYYVYPDDVSVSGTKRVSDQKGNHYYKDENTLTEFHDASGDQYYRDIYGNVWKKVNNQYELVSAIVYYMDGVEEKVATLTSDSEFLDTYYYKDKYGNHLKINNSNKPADPSTDEYVPMTGFSDKYYAFTYTLNDASRSGYRLVSWQYGDLNFHPRPGTERTLKIFFDDSTANVKIVRGVFESTDSEGNQIITVFDDYSTVDPSNWPVINNALNDYRITYKAEWSAIDYSVTISPTVNGTVDVFKANADGSMTHITTPTFTARYGDMISISYTPTGNYEFAGWSVTGECEVKGINNASTFITVKGNCTIAASDMGERVVNLTVHFDDDEISLDELGKTTVYLHKKDTEHEYYKMDIRSGDDAVGVPKIYSKSIPIGEYDVCIRYGTATDYQEYTMLGGIIVNNKDTMDFTYYVISAKVVDEISANATTISDIQIVGGKIQSLHMEAVISKTQYVGAKDSLIFGQSSNLISNYAGTLPTVDVKIDYGYKYTIFEGFIEVGDNGSRTFLVNEINYVKDHKTDEKVQDVVSFNLNWTKLDEPAIIIIQASKLSYDVTYALYNENGTPFTVNNVPVTEVVSLDFGDPFLPNVPTDFYQKIGDQRTISGWYFNDSMQQVQQVLGFNQLDNSVIDNVKAGGFTLYGKVIEGVTKDVSIELKAKNIEDDGYSPIASMKVPLLRQNDGSYLVMYNLREVAGMTYEGYNVPEGFHVEKIDQQNLLRITAVNENSWPSDTSILPVIEVLYLRNSVTIQVTNPADQIESGAWPEGKTAVFGEEVPLPIMKKNENGDQISGWTPSEKVINRDGAYYYRVGAEDAGTISFTANYPPKTLKVTFLTPIGKFENNNQRYEVTVVSGNKVTEPALTYDDDIDTLKGFYDGDEKFSFNTAITSDMTLVAKWTVAKYNFKAVTDGHASVSVVTTKTPDDGGVYSVEHGTEIVLNINPAAGYDLDIDATLTASGLTSLEVGSPDKLLDNRGYSWSFYVTKNITFSVVTKVLSADVNFIVNGTQVDNVVIEGYTGHGKNIPLYTTITFHDYSGVPWYKGPNSTEALEHVSSGGVNTYTLTVKETISLYTTSNKYTIQYHGPTSNDLRTQTITIQGVSETATLESTPFAKAGYIFIGWATLNEYGEKVFTYKPGATITLDTNTSVRMDLYAYYLKNGTAEYIYDGKSHYSALANDENQSHGVHQVKVRYATSELTSLNYTTVGNADPGAINFTTPGDHRVYYYGVVMNGSTEVTNFSDYFVVTILNKNLIKFVSDGEVVDQRRVADGQTAGDPPANLTKDGYRISGWYTDLEDESTLFDFDTPVSSNLTLNAKWIRQYTVTFDSNGGSEVESNIRVQTVDAGTTIVEPADDPTRENYRFDGWYATGTSEPFDFETLISANITLTAHWTRLWTVTIDPDNGDPVQTLIIPNGDRVPVQSSTITKAPSDTHSYAFDGWYVGDEQYRFSSTPVTSDLRIYAKWTEVEAHVIKIYSLPRSGIAEYQRTIQVYDGQKVVVPDGYPPAQRGLIFQGFKVIDVTVTPYAISSDYYNLDSSVTSSFDLVTDWVPKNYTVTFDANGGTGGAVRDNVNLANPAVIPSVTYSGYRLMGWSTSSDGDVQFSAAGVITFPLDASVEPLDKNNVTFYAIWMPQSTVTFDSNGGSDVPSQTVDRGQTINEPTVPTRENYRFDGWYAPDESTPFDFSTQINQSFTLTAHWTRLWTVTFDPNNGEAVTTKIVPNGTTTTAIANPSKQSSDGFDYSFNSWYKAGETSPFSFNRPITESITLTAQYLPTAAPVVSFYYQNADGTVNIDPVGREIVYRGQTVERLDGYTPQQRGSVFAGWYVFTFNNDNSISLGDAYIFGSTTTSSINLITQWEGKQYHVTFDSNGGTPASSTMDVTGHAAEANITANPVKEGYRLLGWTYEQNGDVLFTDKISLPLSADVDLSDNADITLYAKWVQRFTVSFDSAGGTAVESQTVDGDGKIVAPANPTKPATATTFYTFAGWYVGSSQATYDFNTPVTESFTLTAHWTETGIYTVSFYSQVGGKNPIFRESVTVLSGNTVSQPDIPAAPDRMTFDGWYQFYTVGEDKTVVPTTKFDFSTAVIQNYDLVVVWNPDKYTVDFYSETTDQAMHKVGSMTNQAVFGAPTDITVENPVREGYSFLGWSTSEDGQVEYTTKLTRDLPVREGSVLNLYAVWVVQYTVTFDSAGGSSVLSQKVNSGSNVSIPADPTKDDHRFTGWFKENGDRFYFSEAITANITLIAHWESLTKYSVSFYYQDEAGNRERVGIEFVTSGETAQVLSGYTPSLRGASSYNWHTFTINGDNIVISETPYNFSQSVTADINLITVWTYKTYNVTFDYNLDTAQSSSTNAGAYAEEATITASPEKSGFRLMGWTYVLNGDVIFTDKISLPLSADIDLSDSTDIILHAKWVQQVTVSFDSDYGTAVESQTVDSGSKITVPANPTKASTSTKMYTFAGWYEGSSQSTYDFNTPVTESFTLTAHWTETNIYAVSFYSQVGGTNPVLRGSVTVLHGNTISQPVTPVAPARMTFNGWYEYTIDDQGRVVPTAEFDFSTPVTKNYDLVVVWDPYKYTVDFYSVTTTDSTMHKVGTMENQEVFGAPTAITVVNPVRAGYSFLGWSTSENGEVEYTDMLTRDLPVRDNRVLNLYAIWVIQYTVTFDSNGGTAVQSQKVDSGSTAIRPTNPSKDPTTGMTYEFGGWYKEGTLYNFTEAVTGNTTLIAQWIPHSLPVVSFYSNNSDGSVSLQQRDYVNGGHVTIPSGYPPAQRGLDFEGWHVLTFDGNGSPIIGDRFNTETIVTSDINLVTQWTPKVYTVTLNHNNETGETVTMTVTAYSRSSVINDYPQYDRHTFKGWSLTATGDVQFTNIISFPLSPQLDPSDNTSVNLYAVWENQCKVSFQSYDGTVDRYVDKNTVISAPDEPVREGYAFTGWFTSDNERFDFTSPITGDLPLTALWVKKWTVTFDPDNGGDVTSQIVLNGQSVERPEDPVKDDHRFLNWYAGTEEFDFDSAITSDVNLKAMWTEMETHLIGFYSLYGGANPTIRNNVPVLDGTLVEQPADPPAQSGLVFLGWYEFDFTDESPGYVLKGKFDFTEAITEDHNLVANWRPYQYTVTFNYGEGTGTIPDMTLNIYQTGIPIDNSKATFVGHVVKGWGLSADSDEIEFTDTITHPLSNVEGAIVTLFAKWEERNYQVTFHNEDGSDYSVQIVGHGAKAARPDVAERDGYRLVGWKTEDGILFDFNTPIVSNITLTMQWIKQYTVIFDSNGGSAVEPQKVDEGGKVAIPQEPHRSGYTLARWTLPNQDAAYDFNTPVAGNITLVAKWVEDYIPPEPSETVERETKIIDNDDGSQTIIDIETIKNRDGSVTVNTKETTEREDGSSTVKETTTDTDRYGRKSEQSVTTDTQKDSDGNTVVDVSRTVENKDSTKVFEERHSITDSQGELRDFEAIITNTGPAGYSETVIIRGDSNNLEALVPNTQMPALNIAQGIITELDPKAAAIVFDSDTGSIIIPAGYIKEVSESNYSIRVESNDRDIKIDADVVHMLSNENDDAILTIEKIGGDRLTEEQRETVGENYALSLTIKIAGHTVSSLGGLAHIAISCDEKVGYVYYVKDDGSYEEIECSFDEETYTMYFVLTHFSVYTLTNTPLGVEKEGQTVLYIAIALIAVIAVIGIAAYAKSRRV